MTDLFVSYSSVDVDRVRSLVAVLEERGWSVWWDRALATGSTFDDEIENALEQARCVIVVWSKNSINSRWVKAEANEGLERDVLIPLLIDDVKPPLVFRTAQAAKMFEWPIESGQFDNALVAISELLGAPRSSRSKQRSRDSKPSIAVLPFANMSSDPENEYFSDGISEDILNGLANSSELIVKARTSSFSFKGRNLDVRSIASQLNVSHILEGSVRRFGNRVRVTAQLIAAERDAHVWSEQYNLDLTDVFAVQDEIARNILSALNLHLTRKDVRAKQVINIEAYNLYLKGRHHRNLQQFDLALEALEQSVEEDPRFAEVYLELVLVHRLRLMYQAASPEDAIPLIERYTLMATNLDPNLPLLIHARVNDIFFVERDYQRAIIEFDAVVRRFPNEMLIITDYALALRIVGHIEQAITCQKHAIELDPLNPLAQHILGSYLIVGGYYDEARECLALSDSLGVSSTLQLAFLAARERNVEELEALLIQDEATWRIPSIQRLYQATLAYIRGDEAMLAEVLGADGQVFQSLLLNGTSACLLGRVDLAVRNYSKALEAADKTAFMEVAGPYVRDLTPEVFSHPDYQAMLEKFGLDKGTVESLHIPELPLSAN